MSALSIGIVAIIGYLLGSVSFAVIIARSQGVDILKFGSGNPGATNVTRALGSKWGKLVFVLDACKGLVASGWPLICMSESQLELGITGLIASIIGHSYSIFLGFRGGKGVATTMGGLLALMPGVLLVGAVCWVILYSVSRMVALASLVFAVSLPISASMIYQNGDPRFILGLVLGILIFARHRSNIRRMLQGAENSFK